MKQQNATPKKQGLKRLLPYLKKSRMPLIAAFLSAVVSVGLGLFSPLLVGDGIDVIVEGHVDFPALLRIIGLLLAVYLLAAAFQWLLSYCTNVVCYRTVRDLRDAAFTKIHQVPLKAIDRTPHGDIVARVTADAEAVGDGLLQGVSQLMTGVATIVGTMIFLLSINVWVALVVLVLTPLSILVAKQITGRSHHLFREQSETQGELTAFVSERSGNQKLSLMFSQEKNAVAAFDEINGRLKTCGYRAQLYGALVNPVTRFVNHLVYVAVGVTGGLIALSRGLSVMSIGSISACLTYANQYTKPFNEISSVMTQLQTALAALNRIMNFLDTENEQPDAPDAVSPAHVRGDITFSHVCFGYTPERPLIEDMQLQVKAGQQVAIVGPTGAGKTTLVNLLMRFYEIDAGDILIDGESIYHMKRNGMRALFGMVLQESWLRQGTVRENIAYGRPDATEEEIIAAAKAAHAHSFIKRLPNGYDTVIGAGSGLSQGQMQLLCIARVMLADPPLLILDEATSAIDTRTELKIAAAFDQMMQGRTSFIVAHRLSTIRGADTILVMKDGHIIEQGNHETLLQKGGFYHTLYYSQFAASREA